MDVLDNERSRKCDCCRDTPGHLHCCERQLVRSWLRSQRRATCQKLRRFPSRYPQAFQDPHASFESENCTTFSLGLDHIDSVGVSFKNECGWESDSPDGGAGANVYVFATGINVNNGSLVEGPSIDTVACQGDDTLCVLRSVFFWVWQLALPKMLLLSRHSQASTHLL